MTLHKITLSALSSPSLECWLHISFISRTTFSDVMLEMKHSVVFPCFLLNVERDNITLLLCPIPCVFVVTFIGVLLSCMFCCNDVNANCAIFRGYLTLPVASYSALMSFDKLHIFHIVV